MQNVLRILVVNNNPDLQGLITTKVLEGFRYSSLFQDLDVQVKVVNYEQFWSPLLVKDFQYISSLQICYGITDSLGKNGLNKPDMILSCHIQEDITVLSTGKHSGICLSLYCLSDYPCFASQLTVSSVFKSASRNLDKELSTSVQMIIHEALSTGKYRRNLFYQFLP
jgi:hypothetical protein